MSLRLRLDVCFFGRRQQVEFARRACERMNRLTSDALRHGGEGASLPRAAERAEVRTTGSCRSTVLADE